VIRARLDAATGQPGREVVWSASEFAGFRRGYAGTIYKGQGRTLGHTHLYHTHHWRSAASYVALTRQRESA
jgi:ATP-dependent exoDNAse (exonuclease V) alpha subunit